jgi:beta-phosphoglucomutase-like phosphatase (HAD superfamily)
VIKTAIFDMDGLLIDSERIIMQACIQAAKDVGITYTQAEFVDLIGRSSSDASRIMAEQLNGVENLTKIGLGVERILSVRNHTFPLKLGALELLQYYQSNNVICAVASSSPISHIQHRLSQVGILDYFSSITSGQEVANGKPSPDIYLLAIKRLGISVEECIAFEDSEPGAHAAIAAGLKVVVVPDLRQPSDFVKQNSHKVVANLADYLTELSIQ